MRSRSTRTPRTHSTPRDPVGVLIEQERTRVPELVPIRHGRMLASPFGFYRGAAAVMAADLHDTPTTDLGTQLCGDAHLSNFGAYASAERRLVFDINDFDETLPGPFEWDVKRLATSFVVAGRDNDFTRKQCRKAAFVAVEQYRTAMRDFAKRSILDVWYARLEVDDALATMKASLSPRRRKRSEAGLETTEKRVAEARSRDSLQAIGKMTTVVKGRRRIASRPPLIVPIDELVGVDIDLLLTQLRSLVTDYRDTLQTRPPPLARPLRSHGCRAQGRRCRKRRHAYVDPPPRIHPRRRSVAAPGQSKPRRPRSRAMSGSRSTRTTENGSWRASTSCRRRATSSSDGSGRSTSSAGSMITTTCGSCGTGRRPSTSTRCDRKA